MLREKEIYMKLWLFRQDIEENNIFCGSFDYHRRCGKLNEIETIWSTLIYTYIIIILFFIYWMGFRGLGSCSMKEFIAFLILCFGIRATVAPSPPTIYPSPRPTISPTNRPDSYITISFGMSGIDWQSQTFSMDSSVLLSGLERTTVHFIRIPNLYDPKYISAQLIEGSSSSISSHRRSISSEFGYSTTIQSRQLDSSSDFAQIKIDAPKNIFPDANAALGNLTVAFSNNDFQKEWRSFLQESVDQNAASSMVLAVSLTSFNIINSSGVFPFPSNSPTMGPTPILPAISQKLAAEIAGCVTAAFTGALLFLFLYYYFFKRSKLVVRHPGAVREMIHPHRISEGKRTPPSVSTPSSPPPSEAEKKWVGYMATKSTNLSGTNPLASGRVINELDAQLEVL